MRQDRAVNEDAGTLRAFRAAGAAALLALAAGMFAALSLAGVRPSVVAAQARPSSEPRHVDLPVTPVEGPSWLNHLGANFETSAMGRTGPYAPPATVKYEPQWNEMAGSEALSRPFVLAGSDLYRIDCEACHQPDGRGSPPEIHSLIDPVRAASPVLIEQRMKQMGRPVTAAMAKQLAADAEAQLLHRLQFGGEKMPPFNHLQGAEVEALLAYLDELAGVPGANERQIRIVEPFARVGEHLVKGTCHTCHGATGPGLDPEALLRNVLPSLASLPQRKTIFDVIHKVRQGAPVEMGPLRQLSGGRMPVFAYLTDDEVAAAYLYLIIYPPRP